MRQGSRPAVPDDAAVVEDLLELGDRSRALPGSEIRLAAILGRIKAGDIRNQFNLAVLEGRHGGPQAVDRSSCVLVIKRQLRTGGREPERLELRILAKLIWH